MSTFDWTKQTLLVCDGRLGESYQLPAVSDWGRGHALTLEEAESSMNVCGERIRRASIAVTGGAHWDDVVQAWANDLGAKKWRGAEQPPDMQWETCLQDVCRWLGEFDCLWMQQRPKPKIEVGPSAGALRRLAGDLGVSMDDSDLDLES